MSTAPKDDSGVGTDQVTEDLIDRLVEILDGDISTERARELLEAVGNGSIEQAVELHFFFVTSNTTTSETCPSSSIKTKSDNSQNNATLMHPRLQVLSSPYVGGQSVARVESLESSGTIEHVQEIKSPKANSNGTSSSSVKSLPNRPKRRRLQSTLDFFMAKSSPLSVAPTLATENRPQAKPSPEGNHPLGATNTSVSDIGPTNQIYPQNIVLCGEGNLAARGHGMASADSVSKNPSKAALAATILAPKVTDTNPQSNSSALMSRPLDSEVSPHRDILYSMVVKHLGRVAGTTKRTLKLEALQALFHEALESMGWNKINSRGDGQPQLAVQARLLHMTLDLILGKLTIMTKSKSEKAVSPSKLGSGIVNVSLQVSGSAVSKALRVVLGLSPTQMRESYRRLGDLGDVAADALNKTKTVKSFFVSAESTNKPKKQNCGDMSPETSFSIQSVHECLQAIATVQAGRGSVSMRQDLLVKMFRTAQRDKEAIRFLVRTVLGNMRLGATLKTVLAALATTITDSTGTAGESHTTTSSDKQKKDESFSTKDARQLADRLQKVYNVCPRLDKICFALLQGGIERAEEACSLDLGYPVEPMLANPAHSLEQVENFIRNSKGSAAIAEWKYDGVRCQAHGIRVDSDGGVVKLFSRHLLDQSDQYPDVSSFFLDAAAGKGDQVDSFICDAEIVAVETVSTPSEKQGSIPQVRLLPFQELRRGTSNVVNSRRKVRVYCFDLLYINGRSLLTTPLWKRREMLRDYFVETAGFAFAEATLIPPLPSAASIFEEGLVTDALSKAIDGGAEGLMVKITGEYKVDDGSPESPVVVDSKRVSSGFYESGTRSHEWLKVKRDYVGGSFSDTIDVVPIGAWYGNGRKAKAGYLSPVLLAVYDEDDGVFRSISRCMSFSDSMYESMKKFYLDGIPYGDVNHMDGDWRDSNSDGSDTNEEGQGVPSSDDRTINSDEDGTKWVNCFPSRPPSTVLVTNENPPIWFRPMEVFEVSFADLTISRTHTAAAGLIMDREGRGVALRFPRFKRRRPDKKPDQATTTEQIAQLFYQQSKTRVVH